MDNMTELNHISQSFISSLDEIWNLFNQESKKVQLNTEFSSLLMNAFQIYMHELFPSMQHLIEQKKFYGAAILCRSALDIIIQIVWILNLNEGERDTAIKNFLHFDGTGLKKGKTKKAYIWQETIVPEYKIREIAQELGVDSEVINIYSNAGDCISITTFDYLSKIAHWNPHIINELVGLNSSGHLVFNKSEYLKLAVITSSRFLVCTVTFTLIFMEHFYPESHEDVKKRLEQTQESFLRAVKKIIED